MDERKEYEQKCPKCCEDDLDYAEDGPSGESWDVKCAKCGFEFSVYSIDFWMEKMRVKIKDYEPVLAGPGGLDD